MHVDAHMHTFAHISELHIAILPIACYILNTNAMHCTLKITRRTSIATRGWQMMAEPMAKTTTTMHPVGWTRKAAWDSDRVR